MCANSRSSFPPGKGRRFLGRPANFATFAPVGRQRAAGLHTHPPIGHLSRANLNHEPPRIQHFPVRLPQWPRESRLSRSRDNAFLLRGADYIKEMMLRFGVRRHANAVEAGEKAALGSTTHYLG